MPGLTLSTGDWPFWADSKAVHDMFRDHSEVGKGVLSLPLPCQLRFTLFPSNLQP
jgi:hypothetical protein